MRLILPLDQRPPHAPLNHWQCGCFCTVFVCVADGLSVQPAATLRPCGVASAGGQSGDVGESTTGATDTQATDRPQ